MFEQTLRDLGIDDAAKQSFDRVFVPVAEAVAKKAKLGHAQPDTRERASQTRARTKPICVGLSGAQGSGKTAFAALLCRVLEAGLALRCAEFSIDDIYLGRAERERLAAAVHPLLSTRGVPGTHDVELGLRVITGLRDAEADTVIDIPVFDKAIDDRAPRERWKKWRGRADVIVFEGWCVGAVAQQPRELEEPVNGLERVEDPDGRWRRYVNQKLAAEYSRLFREIDLLLFLQVPEMTCALKWRIQQERELRRRAGRMGDAAPAVMTDAQVERFVMHYERLTRHMLGELPGRADILIPVAADHSLEAPVFKGE